MRVIRRTRTRTPKTNLFHTFYEACMMGRSSFLFVKGENPVMVLEVEEEGKNDS